MGKRNVRHWAIAGIVGAGAMLLGGGKRKTTTAAPRTERRERRASKDAPIEAEGEVVSRETPALTQGAPRLRPVESERERVARSGRK